MTHGMVRKRRQKLSLPPLRHDTEQQHQPALEPLQETYAPRTTLHKTTRRNFQLLKHYQFRQRLMAKCMADPHQRKWMHLTTEEWTSQTCPACGTLNLKLGGKEHSNALATSLVPSTSGYGR
ncbi:hypothetical protein RI367_006645 [Sorochytrium milnesiophthora]